jgi:membrane fusion protein, multidrug efflux system
MHLASKKHPGRAAGCTAVVIVTAATLAALLGCSNGSKATGETSADSTTKVIPVKVLRVEPTDFVEYGRYYGSLTGIKEATLVSYVGGRVESIKASEGAYVKKGASLARIDAAKAHSMLESARLAEEIAKGTLQRTEKLFADGNASQVSLDQAKLGYLTAQTKREEAEQAWRGQLCVTPLSGYVTARHIRQYQELGPGAPTFSVANTRKMLVTVGIPESELGGVEVGNEAEVTVSVLPGRTWQATVTRLALQIDRHSRVSNAELTIENSDKALRPGMTAEVTLKRRSLTDAIVLPTGAIMTDDRGSFVAVATGDEAFLRDITTGTANTTRTVVTDGLVEGDRVIVAGQHLIVDGTKVTVSQ